MVRYFDDQPTFDPEVHRRALKTQDWAMTDYTAKDQTVADRTKQVCRDNTTSGQSILTKGRIAWVDFYGKETLV